MMRMADIILNNVTAMLKNQKVNASYRSYLLPIILLLLAPIGGHADELQSLDQVDDKSRHRAERQVVALMTNAWSLQDRTMVEDVFKIRLHETVSPWAGARLFVGAKDHSQGSIRISYRVTEETHRVHISVTFPRRDCSRVGDIINLIGAISAQYNLPDGPAYEIKREAGDRVKVLNLYGDLNSCVQSFDFMESGK